MNDNVRGFGEVDASTALHRTAALGRVTLETPEEFAAWLAEGKIADAERAVRKEAVEKNKKTAFKSKKR